MPTRATVDPFSPRAPLTRELLERYVGGAMSPEEQREVELHMERDPLVREAVEGLRVPGALNALNDLHPRVQCVPASRWLAGLALVGGLGVGMFWALMPHTSSTQSEKDPIPTKQYGNAKVPSPTRRSDSLVNAVHAELKDRSSTPPVVASIPRSGEHFQRSAESDRMMREEQRVEPIDPRSVNVKPNGTSARGPVGAPRQSHQQVFLHDLKLVHPQELYGTHVPEAVLGVPADRPDGTSPTERVPTEAARAIPYLDYMDKALGKLVASDPRGALDDLYFLLGQYPEDVNALFYAGLCCYDLGLTERARDHFAKARDHRIGTFYEEAEWYGALCTERIDGPNAARGAFERISTEGGFYGAQARERAEQP